MKIRSWLLIVLLFALSAGCIDVLDTGDNQPTTVKDTTTVETTTTLERITTIMTTIPKTKSCMGKKTENCLMFSNFETCTAHYHCDDENNENGNKTCHQCKWMEDWCDKGEECIKNRSLETTSTLVPVTTTLEKGVDCYENSDCGNIERYFYCNYEIELEKQQPHTIGTAVYKVVKVPLCKSPGTKRAKCITSHREVMWQSCSGWGKCTQHNSTFANCTSCTSMGKHWSDKQHKCVSCEDL